MRKKAPRAAIAQVTEMEIQNLIEHCLNSKTGVVFYPCSSSRADYLRRMVVALRNESALQSTQIESLKDSPIFGFGSYWNIKAMSSEEGLYLRRLEKPEITPLQILILVAFAGKSYALECANETEAVQQCNYLRSLYTKQKQKYSNITWPPLTAYVDNVIKTLVHVESVEISKMTVVEISPEELSKALSSEKFVDDDDE